MIVSPSTNVARSQGGCKPQAEGVTITAYRGRTMGLLRRYFHMSMDIGRLPSLLGREFFRARVTSYHVHSFEDVVILVHDVERCLERLDEFARELVARIVLQDYTWDETAVLMGCSRRTVARRFPRTLDLLSEIFLEVGLLRPFPSASSDQTAPACQGAGGGENPATNCAAKQ
ncbi:MAG: sigma factor-like helix-turn-helix DNA-binding protein [Terriglobales bacterium]